MRAIIDTNILIYREDYAIVPEKLQDLLVLLQKLGIQILVHPLSIKEIKKDPDKERMAINLSKVSTYTVLERPPTLKNDEEFYSIIGEPKNDHDFIDDNLLYAVYKNAVHFLISEDKNIRKKADKLDIDDQVLSIEESVAYFRSLLPITDTWHPLALSNVPMFELRLDDPIFDSLKSEYPGFNEWWDKTAKNGREAWVYFKEDGTLGAILICKIEHEAIHSIPPLPIVKRIKICTLKVAHMGYRMGELFIRMSISLAVQNNIEEVYLTHYAKDNDELVELIAKFGFRKIASLGTEDVFLKRLKPEEPIETPKSAFKLYYPTFYDGPQVHKYIVPILPKYHDKLFTDYPGRQPTIFEQLQQGGELIVEGNTIRKAYLYHGTRKDMSEGDILLFYRSKDQKKVTALGIVDKVYNGLGSPDEIISRVGKISVYTKEEMEVIAEKPTTVIIFWWHFYLENPLNLNAMLEENIVKAAPQSVVRISEEAYVKVKNKGGISARFTID